MRGGVHGREGQRQNQIHRTCNQSEEMQHTILRLYGNLKFIVLGPLILINGIYRISEYPP